jgi:NADP-dependent aldehyde dehydrogenase
VTVAGHHLLGSRADPGSGAEFTAIDPRSGDPLQPTFHDASPAQVDGALALAGSAHPHFELAGRAMRARLLEAVADGIESAGDALIDRAGLETALLAVRLQSERGRTTAQLRLFASVVRAGDYLDLRIDRGDPARTPLPRPDVRSMRRALGPVVVFGASNFPLAFSVAGGDTASALAAGCPVVVKAHPSHPGTSELVGEVIVTAVRNLGLPDGTFSLLQGQGIAVGRALVEHPVTRAVGFTGSLAAGRALFEAAARRPRPIPVYAEMGSVNPVFVLPERLAGDFEDLVVGLANSITLGVGQFCTNPGLIVLPAGPRADALVSALAERLSQSPEGTMLSPGIRARYQQGLEAVAGRPGVTVVLRRPATGAAGAAAALVTVPAAAFIRDPLLHHEIFGPATVVVLASPEELELVAQALEGQLTATLHATPQDLLAFPRLRPALEQRVGRLLYGGFPTGVEVCHAMVHGGPYPATTDPRSTSVGTAAIDRFTRPFCWQNFPQDQLPEELRDRAPAGLRQLVDGEWRTTP